MNHTSSGRPSTVEGKVVSLADRIAYINHDIDDARRAGVLKDGDIPREISEILGNTHGERITSLVTAVIDHGVEEGIGMNEPYGEAMKKLRDFMFEKVYYSDAARSEEEKVKSMITFLYEHFTACPEEIPGEYMKYALSEGVGRAAADYIAGMTDRYALGCFESLFVPKVWQYK